MLTTTPGITERFLSKVSKGECWEWQAYRDRDGYGKFFTHKVNGQAVKEYAHRWAYSRWKGEIPAGYEVDHLCRNRGCVNPAHLEAVSKRENNLRSESLSAKRSRQTHCQNGHEYTDESTHISKRGQRRCRICDRSAAAIRRGPRKPHYRSLQTHCIHGHPLSGENLRMVDGRRRCIECQRRASREYQAAKRAALVGLE